MPPKAHHQFLWWMKMKIIVQAIVLLIFFGPSNTQRVFARCMPSTLILLTKNPIFGLQCYHLLQKTSKLGIRNCKLFPTGHTTLDSQNPAYVHIYVATLLCSVLRMLLLNLKKEKIGGGGGGGAGNTPN